LGMVLSRIDLRQSVYSPERQARPTRAAAADRRT